jgi:hypothetical protein
MENIRFFNRVAVNARGNFQKSFVATTNPILMQ